MTASNQIRHAAGAAASQGGKFAPMGRSAQTGELQTGPSDPDRPVDGAFEDQTPVPITELGIADGSSMYITDFDLGDSGFDSIELRRNGDQFTASGMIPVDLYDQLIPDTQDHGVAEKYLNDREPDINSFLADRYGAKLEDGNTEWDMQAVEFTATLDPAVHTTADLITQIREQSNAIQLHNDLAGAYQPDRGDFYSELRQDLAARKAARDEAQVSIAPSGATATAPSDPPVADTAAATYAALDVEIQAYQLAKYRVEMLSAKGAAQMILETYPDATHLQLDFSDQEFGAMVPTAILDANGDGISDDDDYSEIFDDISGAVSNLYEDGGWVQHRSYANRDARWDNENPRLDLQAAAAIDMTTIGRSS